MLAWKFLAPGAVAPFTGAGRQLIAARGRLVGRVHAWPDSSVGFTGGCIERTRRRVIEALHAAGQVAEADRLAARREAEAEREVALAIAAAGPFFVGYVADVIRRRPYPGTCAYMAANAAAALGGGAGHDEERAEQAAWLRDGLKLAPR